MKKILITGFDPFGGAKLNPAWEAVAQLPDIIGDKELTKLMIPTVYGKAAETVIAKADAINPDAILCIGLAAGRAAVTPELIGINLRESGSADNKGNVYKNVPIAEDGPAAYFSTLPVREMVKAIKEKDIPSSLSMSAGAFVCNDTLYSLLHRFSGTETAVGFIHVPNIPSQTPEGRPSMELEKIIEALKAALSVM